MTTILLLLAIKLTVLFGLAGVVSVSLRRRSAASRHLVWGLALAGALLLPALSGVAPRMEVVPVEAERPAAAHPTGEPPTTRRDPGSAATPMTDFGPVRPPASAPSRARAMPAPVLLLWGAGSALLLVMIGASMVATARLARRGAPVHAGPIAEELAQARVALGIRRPVRLLLGRGTPMPMTWGAVRPVILLPEAAVGWPVERRRDVLLHELAHVRRLDWLTQLGARLACAAYWWHPLAWVAARRLRDERELACDDLVLRHGAVAPDYAHHLLELARDLRAASGTALASVPMARPSQLAGRLLAVLDTRRVRSELSRRQAIPAAFVAGVLALPVAGISGAARPDPASLPTPARTETLCSWDRAGDAQSSNSSILDDRVTITIVMDGCELSVRSRGRVRFTDDERDVAELGIDSWFEIEERATDRQRRRAELERRDGEMVRRWFVDGGERPWDAEAAEWLPGALQAVFRRTGFQARERAERIYARGGGAALLAEIERLHSSSALTTYLAYYAERETIGSDEARRLARIAGERITSSSGLARVLTTLLANPALDESARAEIVAAGARISSSSERARVLVSAAQQQALSPGLADAVLASAAEISSSSERARVLTTVGRALPADDALPATYLSAARGISSSSELARVLRELLERDRLGTARLQGVVALSQDISSSSERAGVLRAVVAQNPDAATVELLLEAARGISSSSEKASVLVAAAEARLLTTEALRLAYARVADSISSRSERERALRAAGFP